MTLTDTEKAAAARKSLEYVKDGMVVGLGTGSTATFAIQFLGEQVRDGLKIRGIPTSRASGELARSLMIPLTSFDEVEYTDVTIDGADEVAPGLALIKGGGGALLHEKIVAASSRRLVIVADEHKIVERLGRFPLAGGGDSVCGLAGQEEAGGDWGAPGAAFRARRLALHHRRRQLHLRLPLWRDPGSGCRRSHHQEHDGRGRARAVSWIGFGRDYRRSGGARVIEG